MAKTTNGNYKKSERIIATSYGMIFSFTPARWRSMLKEVAAGKEVQYGEYGCYTGQVVTQDITDLNEERAKDLLAEMDYVAAVAALTEARQRVEEMEARGAR